MVKALSIGIIICSLFFATCTKETETGGDETYGCKNLPYIADTLARSMSKSLKGQVMFSWKNDKNGWNYSIVPNLNIRPAQVAVAEANTLTGEECLKKNLGYFAEGEEFMWVGRGDLVTAEGKSIKLSFPPENIVGDIEGFCTQIAIELTIDQ